jgi:hypothetical protein
LVAALPPGAAVMVGRLVEDVAVFSLPNMRNPPVQELRPGLARLESYTRLEDCQIRREPGIQSG